MLGFGRNQWTPMSFILILFNNIFHNLQRRLAAATHSDRLDIVNDIFIVTLLFDSTRVIAKLPNSEQSYKGKVKTHNYINRQIQSTTGKL
jgi:hypothetical protein